VPLGPPTPMGVDRSWLRDEEICYLVSRSLRRTCRPEWLAYGFRCNDDKVESIRTVRGEIVLPREDVPTQTGDVVVQVEDVSRADAPSVVIGEQRIREVALRGGERIPFAVQVPSELVDDRASYSVRVHIDVSRSGQVDSGDLISTQSYPVLTRGHAEEARVEVRLI